MEELELSKKKKRIKPISINWESLTHEYTLYNDKWRELQELWNVRNDSLLEFSCGFDGQAYTFPMCNGQYQATGIQRVWLDGRKKAVHGSQLGLFIPMDLAGNTVFIVEGISDAVAVYDLGFDVIGKPCATYGNKIIKDLVLESDIHSVVIIPDNDKAGQDSAWSLIKEIRHIVHYSLFEFSEGKDIREHIQIKGKQFVTDRLNRYV